MRRLFLLLSLVASGALAADYYVSPRGSDANPGSETQPWRTIQHAADTLEPGDTAWVRRGRYRERISLTKSGLPGQPITLRAFPGERPVIDGAGYRPSTEEDTALLLIQDQSHIRVQGFTIQNLKATRGEIAVFGVLIQGECEEIELRENLIQRIRYRSRNGNAFGIALYGTSAAKPISRVTIDGNEIRHCRLGNSESLSLNGNVTDCAVTNNRVHDNDNIGIVFIGYEGTCPDPALDRARDSVCRGNSVWNIRSYGNPAYGRNFSAGGIYVDGGTRILIERNIAHHCDIGIELASEHAGQETSEVEARENIVYRNRIGGLLLGGYDELRGATRACRIHHNTFFENDTRRHGNGELYFQHFVTANSISHNIVVAGRQNLLVGNPSNSTSGNSFDHNLYFSRGGADRAEWEWQGTFHESFEAFRSATLSDTGSQFGDPWFTRAKRFDFRPLPGSPAIDTGDPAFSVSPGETDFVGAPRQAGTRVDVGAHELQPPNSTP